MSDLPATQRKSRRGTGGRNLRTAGRGAWEQPAGLNLGRMSRR